MSRGIDVSLAVLLAALALAHPTFSSPSPADAIGRQAPAWLAIHLLLLLAFPALAWRLGRSASPPAASPRALDVEAQAHAASAAAPSEAQPTRWPRAALALFALANTAFVTVDGLLVGTLATRDPGAADALWAAAWLGGLANLVGAVWAAALLLVAWTRLPRSQKTTVTKLALALTWLCFVASAVPGGLPPLMSRAVAAVAAALIVYRGGTAALSAALLAVAAVFRIHAGPEAALGFLLVAGAELANNRARER